MNSGKTEQSIDCFLFRPRFLFHLFWNHKQQHLKDQVAPCITRPYTHRASTRFPGKTETEGKTERERERERERKREREGERNKKERHRHTP